MINEGFLAMAVWVMTTRTRLIQAVREQAGQGIMEYSILLGAIALIAAVALYAADFDFGDMTAEIQDCISFDDTCG
jgi:hypothetical protein